MVCYLHFETDTIDIKSSVSPTVPVDRPCRIGLGKWVKPLRIGDFQGSTVTLPECKHPFTVSKLFAQVEVHIINWFKFHQSTNMKPIYNNLLIIPLHHYKICLFDKFPWSFHIIPIYSSIYSHKYSIIYSIYSHIFPYIPFLRNRRHLRSLISLMQRCLRWSCCWRSGWMDGTSSAPRIEGRHLAARQWGRFYEGMMGGTVG